MKDPRKTGFTLIELIVVVIIIGVLAAFAIPQYTKTVETSKADDALSTVQMIATTNRMFYLDRNAFNSGAFPAAGSCAAGACPAVGPYNSACNLVYCGYLANQDFGSKSYQYYVCDGAGGGGVCCGGTAVACAQRKSGPSPGTGSAFYQLWGYTINQTGATQPLGGAPQPSS